MCEIVSFEIAKKLKEKGFNHKTRCGFLPPIKFVHEAFTDTDWCAKNGYPAPTISQVLKWLREEKKLHIVINFWPAGYNAEIFTWIDKDTNSFCWERYIDECDYYDSYELAAIAGIQYTLDNLI